MILPILAYIGLSIVSLNTPVGYNTYRVSLKLPNDAVHTETVTVKAEPTPYEQWEEIRIHVNAQYYGTSPGDYNATNENL